MLAQRSLGASVCLRCRLSQAQLRLVRTPRLPLAAAAATTTATFTTYTRRLHPDQPNNDPDFTPSDITKDHGPQPRLIRKFQQKPKPTERIFDFRVTRGRKGKKVQETSAPLKRLYLGEESEVLILRDVIPPLRKAREDKDDAPADGEEVSAQTQRRREIRAALEASIAGNQAFPGQEEVNEQIDKLRPESLEGQNYTPFITRKDLKELRKALKDGYNVSQLRRYADVAEGMKKLKELTKEERVRGRVLWKSAWKEGMTPLSERLPEVEEAVVQVKELPKMKVVDRIVREIWEVGVIEESEAVGEIEVKLEKWQLALISPEEGGNNVSPLDNIGFQRNVRVESYAPASIIRFIAARENAEQAVTDLEHALQRLMRMKFDLSVFESIRQKEGLNGLLDFFSQRDIDVAERLSKTIIRPLSDSMLVLYGMSRQAVELGQRILLSMIDLPKRVDKTVLTDTEGEGFLQAYASESALHYRHRRKDYARWTSPVLRESLKTGREEPAPAEQQAEEPLKREADLLGEELAESLAEGVISEERVERTSEDITSDEQAERTSEDVTSDEQAEPRPEDVTSEKAEPLSEDVTSEEQAEPRSENDTPEHGDVDEPNLAKKITDYLTTSSDGPFSAPASYPENFKDAKNTYWSPEGLIELYATAGNVLHRPPPSKSSLSPVSLPDLLGHSDKPNRIFLNTLPGFSPFLRHIVSYAKRYETPNEEQGIDALVFRFVPSPWDLGDTSHLEDFPEVTLRISLNRTTNKARFQGLGLTISERTADVLLPKQPVDLRFTRRHVLWTRAALERSKSIRQYLANLQTNLSGGGAIRAPPKLALRIPAWTVRNADRYADLPSEETEHEKEFNKEYIFSAVEHRQMFRYDLPGDTHRISYTSVEAGRVGGRRGEMRIRLRKPAKSFTQLKMETPGLVDTALDVARMVDDAVHGRLEASGPKIEKYAMQSASFKRMMPDGQFGYPKNIYEREFAEGEGPGEGRIVTARQDAEVEDNREAGQHRRRKQPSQVEQHAGKRPARVEEESGGGLKVGAN